MIELTGKISSDAYAMRTPLVERDARLLSHGFVKQARVDFLDLRRMVLGCGVGADVMNGRMIRNGDEKEKGTGTGTGTGMEGRGERGGKGERGGGDESRGYTNSSQGKNRIKTGVDERFLR